MVDDKDVLLLRQLYVERDKRWHDLQCVSSKIHLLEDKLPADLLRRL